jgi:predicted Zn-dependent peptidase
MALTDPQVVTVNAVAQSMPRILTSGTSAKYQKADESFSLSISHEGSKGNRIRSMARIDQRAIVADPLTAENDYQTLSFYCVLDRPNYGFTQAQIEQLIAGFKTWLDNTMVGKLTGQES